VYMHKSVQMVVIVGLGAGKLLLMRRRSSCTCTLESLLSRRRSTGLAFSAQNADRCPRELR
jgi:hypothetical protein